MCSYLDREATIHLPIRPKSDLTLLYGLAKILVDEGWINHPYIDTHTEGGQPVRQIFGSVIPDRF